MFFSHHPNIWYLILRRTATTFCTSIQQEMRSGRRNLAFRANSRSCRKGFHHLERGIIIFKYNNINILRWHLSRTSGNPLWEKEKKRSPTSHSWKKCEHLLTEPFETHIITSWSIIDGIFVFYVILLIASQAHVVANGVQQSLKAYSCSSI